jgi:hypothetical protein
MELESVLRGVSNVGIIDFSVLMFAVDLGLGTFVCYSTFTKHIFRKQCLIMETYKKEVWEPSMGTSRRLYKPVSKQQLYKQNYRGKQQSQQHRNGYELFLYWVNRIYVDKYIKANLD